MPPQAILVFSCFSQYTKYIWCLNRASASDARYPRVKKKKKKRKKRKNISEQLSLKSFAKYLMNSSIWNLKCSSEWCADKYALLVPAWMYFSTMLHVHSCTQMPLNMDTPFYPYKYYITRFLSTNYLQLCPSSNCSRVQWNLLCLGHFKDTYRGALPSLPHADWFPWKPKCNTSQ